MGTAWFQYYERIIWPTIVIGAFVLLVLAVVVIVVIFSEWYKVKHMERKPMGLCDIHGAYVKSASLWIDAPQSDGSIIKTELCPLCYYEKSKILASTENILNRLKP